MPCRSRVFFSLYFYHLVKVGRDEPAAQGTRAEACSAILTRPPSLAHQTRNHHRCRRRRRHNTTAESVRGRLRTIFVPTCFGPASPTTVIVPGRTVIIDSVLLPPPSTHHWPNDYIYTNIVQLKYTRFIYFVRFTRTGERWTRHPLRSKSKQSNPGAYRTFYRRPLTQPRVIQKNPQRFYFGYIKKYT